MFGFSIGSQPIRKRREETCSYAYEGNIIGRKDDVEKIVGTLTDPTIHRDVSYLTIVGIGGLGKTALAQLVYNDSTVTSAFQQKLWVCVSDHDDKHLNINEILRKIHASATGQLNESITMDRVQNQLRKLLANKKFLLVLDDVWTENHNQWLKLVDVLLKGKRGSWVVVTTRSHETAKIIGHGSTHELQGLNHEHSWHLFQKIAYGATQSNDPHDYYEIGTDIVKGCAGVPLAIRVAGSLLFDQDKSKWVSLKNIGLFNSRASQMDIMPILKLSYYQLELPFKSCFTYCALFPKDFVMEKELLISLWIAQGFIVPLDEGQTLEDAAEECFRVLLRRCFFQEVKHNDYGEVFSCKMHDLMHDMAQKLGGKELYLTDSINADMDEEVRHVTLLKGNSALYSFTKTHIRSYLRIGEWYVNVMMDRVSLVALLEKWSYLRALDLSNSGLKSLPDMVGALVHIRFLDLARNKDLEVLPRSITKLYNLQTLNLTECLKLKELPEDLSKLVNLRVLDITSCHGLTHMPSGIDKLSYLRKLTRFVVGERLSDWIQVMNHLQELKQLKCLTGELYLKINPPLNAYTIVEEDRREGAYLKSTEHLNEIKIMLYANQDDEEAKRLMEELRPHFNLKGLELGGRNPSMPSWATGYRLVKFLPNLIRLQLSNLHINNLICLGNLPHLKTLTLEYLNELEYMIDYCVASATSSVLSTTCLYPSLEKLVLYYLPKLKGWRRSRAMAEEEDYEQLLGEISDNMEPLRLPQLKKLCVKGCLELKGILLCYVVEDLNLQEFNARLLQVTTQESGSEYQVATNNTNLASTSSSFDVPISREVVIDNRPWPNFLYTNAFHCLRTFMWSFWERIQMRR
ncbi:unnamed protein product [Amaranthus hypochondriacus]